MTGDLRYSLAYALAWCEANDADVPLDLLVEARRLGISAKAMAKNYSSLSSGYWSAVYDAVHGYLISSDPITTYKNAIRRAMADAFLGAAEMGWLDGGGTLPMDGDTLTWLGRVQTAEFGYIDALFDTLRGMRLEGDVDAIAEAFRRADGYSATLDMIYNGARLRAAGKTMLTFVGNDGMESCRDCRRLKGKRHRARWWIAHDAVPPNRSFECGGYHCEHYLIDDKGVRVTV